MKKRLLTLLVIVAALSGLTTAVSAQEANACLNLSQEDCDILTAAVANTGTTLESFHANFTINVTEQNQVLVIGVNDANVTIEGEITAATDAAMAAMDPTKAATMELQYTVSGNLGPYGVTGGQSIAYVDGVSYWTDPLRGQWVGISTNDALMLGLGAASVGMTAAGSMAPGVPGMDMVGALLNPSALGDPSMLLAFVNPQAILSDPAGALAGLGLGALPPLFYASMERLEDSEMMGQTMNGFALTLDLGPDLIAGLLQANMGDMAAMIPAEVWDDISATLTLTRWYGADDQLQHAGQMTVDVTVGSTARTFFVSLIAPTAIPADAMLAPAMLSVDVDVTFDELNPTVDIAAPEGAMMITLDSIMGMMGSMTGGQ